MIHQYLSCRQLESSKFRALKKVALHDFENFYFSYILTIKMAHGTFHDLQFTFLLFGQYSQADMQHI
jgi:hypothetical protein